MNRIKNIQTLRFISAFFVILVHLPLFGFGAWGVDIFFIISGFIICYITDQSYDNFLTKRLIRIVPIYWALTFIIFLISIFFPFLLNNTSANYIHLFKSLFFIPFDKNGIGHFPVLFLGWSLNYELLFYLIFFISIKINYKYREYICSALIILLYLISKIFAENNFIFKVYSNSIILEFIYGMFAYKLYLNKTSLVDFFKFNHKGIVVYSSIIIATFFLNYYNFPRVLSYGIPSLLLFIFFLFSLKENFFHNNFVLLGDSSYVIYLIHPYIIQFFYKLINIDQSNLFLNLIFSLISICLIMLISIFIHIYFERKLSNLLKKKLKI